jgi:hypothetical protein
MLAYAKGSHFYASFFITQEKFCKKSSRQASRSSPPLSPQAQSLLSQSLSPQSGSESTAKTNELNLFTDLA